MGCLGGDGEMFIIKCYNCGNGIKIDETKYRVSPTDDFSITINYDKGDHVEINCNICNQTTVIY